MKSGFWRERCPMNEAPDKQRRFLKPGRRERGFQARTAQAAALLPNFLTLCAIICGLTSIRLSGEGQPELAMAAIFAAALLDIADGFAARRLAAASEIGAELDSLADFVNFGVAPAMLLYRQNLNALGWPGWAVAGLYVLATGIRLARFNVQAKAANPALPRSYHRGLPSTAAALAVLVAGTAANSTLASAQAATAIAAAAAGASVLMLSSLSVPTLAVLLGWIKSRFGSD
jgi:CDP-diacylglycerol---serine O-phosphatidyltransferase